VAAAEPGPARLMSALEEFCRLWGPLARVALAARDLPWVRRALGTQPCLFQNAIRLYLGPGAGRRTLCSIATDMLKHACAAGGNGHGAGNGNGHSTAVDPGERAYLIELLSVVCKHQPIATAGRQDAVATAASLRATPPAARPRSPGRCSSPRSPCASIRPFANPGKERRARCTTRPASPARSCCPSPPTAS
jgi:hypothetical protein